MPRINWLDKLNDDQAVFAAKIMEKAEQMGIPPELAVSLAYHESGLNPNRIGEAKEIGIMQVLPSTGRLMGYTPGQLHDPDTNIEAGLKYLKEQLNTFGNAPEIAALAYNRGPGVANQFIAGESDAAGEKYVRSLQGLGAFSGQVQVADQPPEIERQMQALGDVAQPQQDVQAQQMAGMVTGGAGAAVGAKRLIGEQAKKAVGSAAQFIGQQMEQGRMAAGPLGAPAGAPAGPRATGPGSAVQNYARAFGLGDIEAQRALDMTKQEGGVHDLTTKRREALQEIRSRFPSETYVENPRYGGLMTPDYESFGGPRAPGTPRPVPIPTTPIKPSGLEQVSQMFRTMMGKGANVLSRGAAPLAAYSIGSELTAAGQELKKPQPDPISVGASAAGALGGALSLFPPTAAIGLPLSIAGPMVRQQRERMKERAIPPEQIQQMLQEQQPAIPNMIKGLGGTQTFQ